VSETYDVVIVGAGVSGAILANKLGQAGARVLLMDVGEAMDFSLDPQNPMGTDHRQPLLDRFYASLSKVPNSPYRRLPWAPMPRSDEPNAYYTGPAYTRTAASGDAPPRYASTYTRGLGGTTYHWLGTMLRYLPSTFEERTAFGHSVDWPIGYMDLEDWYWQAERELGVSGDSSAELGSPRFGKAYPMPKILPSYTDQRFAARLQGMSFEGLPVVVESTPQARNSVPFDGRPPCAGSTNCVPICPIQAKYDATVHLKRALNPALDPEDRPGSRPVELLRGAVVTRVLIDAAGEGDGARVTGLSYLPARGGDPVTVEGRHYVLAAHGIETAKILLMSPWGDSGATVANSSDCVGRYLMDHNIKIAVGKIDEPLYPFRGPLSTSGIESLRDGPFRRHRGAFRVELQNVSANWGLNTPWSNLAELVNANVFGAELYERLGWEVNRTVQFEALIEPQPQHESTIRPSKTKLDDRGVPRPEINFVIDEFTLRGAEAFERLAVQMFAALGAKPGDYQLVDGFSGAGHVMGTFRMGVDPKQSVTDSYGRTHDHPNLWLTGSGLFPTVDSANPTETIVALTLRTAAKMIAELGEG
jgi:choline dehydrogenase-like flavoprotein